VRLAPGEALAFEGRARPAPGRRAGCRAYLALPGGIDVPVVLGGRGTALGAGFGGIEGRALRPGDMLAAAARPRGGSDPGLLRSPARWPGPMPSLRDAPLRVLPGPHAAHADPGNRRDPAAFVALAAGRWTVAPASDRIGVRLSGDPLPGSRSVELASHGVIAGAVQVPPDGRPIILLADHQPTGGYPVVAVVIGVDRPGLGQLAPGDRVVFAIVDEAAARTASARRREARERAITTLHEAAAWDDLWHGAGG
jgi:allophanate hydrolase subunit 2